MRPMDDASVMNHAPIGLLDSGLGGLSVALELHRLLPHERLLYLADQAMLPYGDKPAHVLRARVLDLGLALYRRYRIKALVLACNTATAAAAEALRQHLPIPVIGMEPAIKPAASATRARRIGVLATEATLRSARFARLVQRFARGIQIFPQPCPGLVEAIEQADMPRLDALLMRFVPPLRNHGVDTIVLGCTHYPLVRERIARLAGPNIALIDTGAAVARHTRQQLALRAGLRSGRDHPPLEFISTDQRTTAAQLDWLLNLHAPAPASGRQIIISRWQQ